MGESLFLIYLGRKRKQRGTRKKKKNQGKIRNTGIIGKFIVIKIQLSWS